MKWTTKWLSVICSQSCVYVINATVTVAGSHGVAPSRPKRRKPTNDKLMTQQTTLQKIRFENGFAVAKSIIEYVMCRIEEIRLQLQGSFHKKGWEFHWHCVITTFWWCSCLRVWSRRWSCHTSVWLLVKEEHSWLNGSEWGRVGVVDVSAWKKKWSWVFNGGS